MINTFLYNLSIPCMSRYTRKIKDLFSDLVQECSQQLEQSHSERNVDYTYKGIFDDENMATTDDCYDML